MHLDPRRRGDPQRWKIIEVVLLHAPVGDGDLVAERGTQAEGDAALELRPDPVGVHHLPAIHGAYHAFDARGTLGAGTDLGDLREVTAEGKLQRHAAPAAGGQRRAPSGAIGREIEHRAHARVLEQRAAVAHRVLLRRRRQLVHETLYREYAARRTDPTPPARRHPRRVAAHEAHFHVL